VPIAGMSMSGAVLEFDRAFGTIAADMPATQMD
jgi:hypothetical protein